MSETCGHQKAGFFAGFAAFLLKRRAKTDRPSDRQTLLKQVVVVKF